MFYVPRTQATMQMPQVQQQMSGGNRAASPMNTSSQVPGQQQNPLNTAASTAGNVASMYKTGKEGMGLAHDVGNLYSRMTMPSGINPASVLAGSGTEAIPGAANLLAGGSAAFPIGAAEGTGTASFLGGSVAPTLGEGLTGGAGAGYGALESGAAASPLLAGATDAGLLAGSTGAEGAAAAAGAAAPEAAGLGMLGPIGILAGAGLLGYSLFGGKF